MEELNGRASARVPCQEDITFGTGSILSMTMDRNLRLLSVEVNSGPSVNFTSIDPDAIPFVNLRGENDAVEIITAEQVVNQSPFFCFDAYCESQHLSSKFWGWRGEFGGACS